MTPAIAEALAALVLSIHPGGVAARKGDALCVALGLDADASWHEVATALRALARPDVGLPEGWTGHAPHLTASGRPVHTASGPDGVVQMTIDDEGVRFSGYCYAPPAVYAHLLRAAGVAS